MEKPGYIVPPPGLIPSSPEESSETVRLTDRTPVLPVFIPGGPSVIPQVSRPLVRENPTPIAAPPSVPEVQASSVDEPPPATPSPAQWSLTLHDGSVIHVSGTLLLGRDPGRIEGWESASLLRINDPEKSVSKTHAALDCSGESCIITDLDSTNGVAVTSPDGTEAAITPGHGVSIESGSTVELGRYRILLSKR